MKAAQDSSAISNEAASLERSHPGESERIERLECLVAQLLIKNQVIRFELYASRQKFDQVKELLIGIDAHCLDRLSYSELILLVGGLYTACEVFTGGGDGVLTGDRSRSGETMESALPLPAESERQW